MDKWDETPQNGWIRHSIEQSTKNDISAVLSSSSTLSVQCDEIPLEIFGLICVVPEKQKLLEAWRIRSEQRSSASEKNPHITLISYVKL